MKKIPTLFVRDPHDRSRVTDHVTPGCEWVLAGEGTATRKYDGTCVMFDGEQWWTRREVKPGTTPPAGWREVDHDTVTGKRMGWEPAEQSPYVKPLREALEPLAEFAALLGVPAPTAGTYELVGPKINGNPEGAERHRLEPHANAERLDWVRPGAPAWTYADVRTMMSWLRSEGIEGVVWHHPDGRMVKIKTRDFPTKETP